MENEKERTCNKDGSKMPKKKYSVLQKGIIAVFGVMIAYTSQYTPDPVVRTGVLFLGMFVVLFAVIR